MENNFEKYGAARKHEFIAAINRNENYSSNCTIIYVDFSTNSNTISSFEIAFRLGMILSRHIDFQANIKIVFYVSLSIDLYIYSSYTFDGRREGASFYVFFLS